jgi:chaperonin GroEL (HSP60 family)
LLKIIGIRNKKKTKIFIYFIYSSSNLEQFKSDLMNIARTTLSSKILQGKKDHFAKLCVDAVLKLHVKSSCFFFL